MIDGPKLEAKLEEIRECSRNLWRANALREREHYYLIQLVDDAEKIVRDANR